MVISHLVTGGAGFIGLHLIEFLLSTQDEVIAIDIKRNRFIDNLLLKYKTFKFQNLNINKPFDIKVQNIWHLANNASPLNYLNDPINTLETSFNGTKNVLELAKKYNSRILLASSSEIYGDADVVPQKENYNGNVNTFNERACYAEGKRISETLFYEFYKRYDVDIRIARIFNTYGPNLNINDGRVICDFIQKALNGEALTIHGDGSQKRSFCYISDMIEGLYQLMNKNYKYPINLGNDEYISILNLANFIKKKVNNKIEINFVNKRFEDPRFRKPCIKLAYEKLNWKPKINLNNGLELTIDFIKKNRFDNVKV